MSENFSPQAEKVMRKIAASKNPFLKLERLMKMDPDHKVLKRHPDGRVVTTSIEVLIRIMELIHDSRRKSAKVVAEIPQSNPASGLTASVAPSQAKDSNSKHNEPKNLP